MFPSKKISPKKKRDRKVSDIGEKLKIINLLEQKEQVAAVARKFRINESTVRTIRKNKENILKSASNLGKYAHLSKVSRNFNIVKMEEMLMLWIQDHIYKKIPLDTRATRQQALELYEYLKKKSLLKKISLPVRDG